MMYAKIIFIRRNGTDGNFYPLTSRTCLFGRHKDCDIPIQLREVEDNHCQINVKEDGEILLTNLTGNSTSVSLNGSPVINTVPLRHRDVFCIRTRSFRFEVPNPLPKNPSNKNAVSGAELVGVISQINSSDGSHQTEDAPQPLVMENTEHKNIETQGSSVSVTDGNNIETQGSSVSVTDGNNIEAQGSSVSVTDGNNVETQGSSVSVTHGNNVETRRSATILGGLNSSGLQMCHLRRIGPPATKPGVADVMDFWKVTSLIGRKAAQTDFLIDSSDYVQGAFVSRLHARMVRRQNNTHRLFDDSLNGVFVNNFKIAGHVDLQVGDRVTFGHPQGTRLPAGTRVHQPDSEYQFMFEICSCPPETKSSHHQEHNSMPHIEEHNVTRVPSSFRVPSELCGPKPKTAKKQRNASRTFTQEDLATCQSQNGGTSIKVEMNEDSDQEQNSIFKSSDKMQTVPVRKDDSLETGHVGSDEVQQTGSRTEVDAMHRSVERMAEGDVEHNIVSFGVILGHLQEEAVPETGPSGSGLGSNERQQVVPTGSVLGSNEGQVVPTGSVTCMASMNSNSVTVIHQDTVPNMAVLNERKPGIGNQEEFIAEDLSSPGLEASICGGQLVDNAGFRTVVNDSDVDMEAVDGEELVQNESPKNHQNLGKDDAEEGQAKGLFDFNDISVEQVQDTLISVEQVEAQQSVNVLDNNVNAEQIFKCSDKSVTEIEKKESSTPMVALSMPEPDLDDEFNEIAMKVKTELLAVSSQGDGTNDDELGGDASNSAQDKIYVVDSQVENIHPNFSFNGSVDIISAGESGAINTEAVDRTEIPGLDHKIGLSVLMDMEVSDPVSHGTEDSHASFVNSFDNKNYGKEEVFETGSALIAEKISVKDSRQPYVDEIGCQPMKSAEQEQLIQVTKELNNDTAQQNIESVDTKEKVHGLIDNVLKSVENVELKNTSFHQMVETSDMSMHLASEVEGTNGVPVSHNHGVVDNSHFVKDTTSTQQQSVSVDAIETYQNMAFHEKESIIEIADPGKQLNHVVETEKGSDNSGKDDFIFGEKELAQKVSYTEGIMDREVASFKMQDDTDKLIFCFEEDFAKEASDTGQQDDDNTMSDRSLQNILANEKTTGQIDTSPKLNVLSGSEDNSTSVLLDLRIEREPAVSLSQKESFADISREDNFSDIISIKDTFSEIMANPEEKMEPGHVFIGNNKVEFVNDGKSTNVISVQGKDRDQEIFSFENKSFQDFSNTEEDSLKLVASFEKESSELITTREEKIKTVQMCIENNNELEVISDLDGKSTIAVSVQEKDRDQKISSFEKKSFQDISHPEEKCFIPVASFEKQSSEVISDPEEKMEQGIVPMENNELQVVSDTRQNFATVLSDSGKERDRTSVVKKSLKVVSKPEEDNFSEVASFEEKSLESVPDPEEKIEHGHNMSVQNNELEVLSDHENNTTVQSDQGEERDQGILMFQKESFENVNKTDEDNFRNVASFEDSSSEVISKCEENMDPGHVTLENNELEVLSDLDEKSSTTVLSDQRKEWNHTVSLSEKKSFEDIPNVGAFRFKDIASFEKKSLEATSNPEEKMEPGHVFIENKEFLSDLDEKSITVHSVQGQERDQGIPFFEKDILEGISYPEEDSLKLIASFENESSEVITNPEEKMDPGDVSMENNELEAISDLDKKPTNVVCLMRKERECDFSSFKTKSFQDKSNTEELNFIPVASFEKETSEVTSNPEEKKEQGLVSVENNELDLDEKSTTVPPVQEKEKNQTVSLYEKESFEDISNPEGDRLKHVAFLEKESSEVITNPEEKIKPGQMSIENNNKLEVLSDHEKSSTILSEQGKVDQGISLLQKENVTNPKVDNFRNVASFEYSSSEIISISGEKMDPGHVTLENNELEVLSDLNEKSTTVLTDPGCCHAVASFEKKPFQDVSKPEEANFSEVASFEEKSSESVSYPEENKKHGHMSVINNELDVLSDLDKKSTTVLSDPGNEEGQNVTSFEKKSFQDVLKPKENKLSEVASFEEKSLESVPDPEEKIEHGHMSIENNELEVLSDLDEKSFTVQSDQGEERNQTVSFCKKDIFEDVSNPEVDRLKHVAFFEKESLEVITNPEDKMEPGQMSIENNNELEAISDLDKKYATLLCVHRKEREQGSFSFEKKSFQDSTDPKELSFIPVGSCEKFSEVISDTEERMEQGHVFIANNEREVLSNFGEKSSTVQSVQGKERHQEIPSFEKDSFDDISNHEENSFKVDASFEKKVSEEITNSEEKMDPGHVSVENSELEVISDHEKSSTILSEQGKVDQGILLFQKENVTNPKEDNFRHVASFEDFSSEIISISGEKMDPGHVTLENNELEVLSNFGEKSSTVQSVQGKERHQEIPSFEKESFDDISNHEENSLKVDASFEKKVSEEITNSEEKMDPGHVTLENNELEVLSDLNEKSTTVLFVQGNKRDQGIPLFEKVAFEYISNPEEDSLKHVASLENESSEVIATQEEKKEPGQMSVKNNELEVLSDLDKTVLSDPGKDRDLAVPSFGKVEKMEQVHVSVEKYDLEFLSDLDEKSAKGEILGAVLLDDKSHDADKKCSNSLSYEKKDESYDAVCQDEAQERQPFSQLLTKNKTDISEHEHSFSDQSNTGDVREGTFQQGCSQDLFENSSQSNVSGVGCTDMIYGIASAVLKSIETVESVSKAGKKRKLSEIFQENAAAADDNGCVPTGVPFKKMFLPENEHSVESFSKDEVIKDKSLMHMDWHEMQSPLEHKIMDTKVVVENDTAVSYGCATNSFQNTDSDRQQFLLENDREIENNHIRKYFPGEDQSTLPNDCGGKTSEFKDNCAHDKEAICIVDTVDDSSYSMNLTFSNERHYLPENRLETNEEFLGRVSSKEISDTENHTRVEDCNVAMNDEDCNMESPSDSLRLLSATGEFQITDMEDLSSREFKADSTVAMSDENAESSELVSDKDAESSELASDKDAESSVLVSDKDADSSVLVSDKDAESSVLVSDKDADSSVLVSDKDADSSKLVSDKDAAESSVLVSDKDADSSVLVSDKDADSSKLVSDKDAAESSELVSDKDAAESSELVSDKDAESSQIDCVKDAGLPTIAGDGDVESSELVSDKDAESAELVIVEDVKSELVMDKDVKSSDLIKIKGAKSPGLVIDKDAESSELIINKDAESLELVIDKDAESSELIIDKDAESSEHDTNAGSSELVIDKDAELSELVIDKDAESSELVMDKDAESPELVIDKDAESSELVIDKNTELSELIMDKDAESELVINKDAELSELVIDKDAESSELIIDKDAESSELDDTNAESSELVIDKDAESSELVIDKDAESSELVIDKDAESSELVIDKDAESSELVIDKDAESSELVIDKDAESSEHVINKDAELSELVMDNDAESSEFVISKVADSSELVIDKNTELSELAIDKDAVLSELVLNKDAESLQFGDTNAESSELVMDIDAESSKIVINKDAGSSKLVIDKNAESSELGDTNAELYAESSNLIMDKDAELSKLVMDKDAESSELVIDEDAELSELEDRNAESSELVDKDVESSKLVFDKDSELSENGNSGSLEEDLYINDSSIKDKPERQYYIQDEETTSPIEPCDQSEGSSQRSDDLHTEPAMHPDLDTAKQKACDKRGCGEEINRDIDELLSVQRENRDKQGEVMQLTDKSSVLNAKKTWQLSEKGIKSETKSEEFAPYVEGHGEDMNPCSSPESEPLIGLGSDDWDANSDVAMDTTENDTDSTLNDSTMRCLPFISAPVNSENVISVDQVKETSRCLVWASNYLDDFSQQHAMSPVIPQQARIFPKASTADHDELLFSDQSDDDDNGISSLKISALVDEIQTTTVVDEAVSLLEKTPNFSSNVPVVSNSLEFKKETISTSERSDDSDHFNLDFSGIVDDVIYDDDDVDDDERPVYDRYKDVSNVNPSDEENVEDEDYVNENEHVSDNFGGNIEHVDMEDNENVDEKFHEITSDDNISDNFEEEEPDDMLTRRKSGCSSGVKRKLKMNDNEYESLPEKVRRPFKGPLDSPIEGQKLKGKKQRCNKSASSSSDSHGQGKNVSYPDQSDSKSTESELSLDAARSPSKYTSLRTRHEYKFKEKSRFQTIKEKLIHLSKDSKEESNSSSQMASSSSSQESLGETPSNSSSQHNQFPPEGDHSKVTALVTRCKSILEKFRQILNRQMDVLQTHRMQALIEELRTIEKWSEMPRVVIAVVGNTGDGKSSLMNAILGHNSILPTSGIRACTAVVVEVVQNSGSLYEGCIEFLTKEEWYSELERLINDLTSSDGKLRKNPPEPGTDQYVSYCKVKAVYGKIDKFEVLAGINKVTSHLGKKETVKCKQAKKFRLEMERYIETQEPQSGGQFWPIVKRVQLRLPNCNVCRTGAVLVDLPGVRDSNAARDKIARDYLKTCSAIWVVSAIHRAIDDKTAQDLLTENFRRQLLMDGQYGSVAFICTKSDQFENSEIIRTLKLQNKCKDHEHKICIMEKKRQHLLEEIKICRKKTIKLNKEIMSSLKDREDLQTLVQDIETQQMDANQNEIQELETQIRQRRRKLSHICASARNDYCREKIKQKFQSGLKEIKRQANRLPDEDDDDDEEDDDEDAEEVNRMVNSLKVFCCSSTEYQKMKELIPADGEPTVFNSPEETEIPLLQAYVHELTRIRHEQYLERLIRGLGRCTFNFQSYLLDGGTECVETRTGVKLVIEKYLQDLNSMIQLVLQKMAEDLESTFNEMIQAKFHEGVGLAAQEVTGICQKWGSKQSTDQANRRAGGLHYATYKATIQRLGVYSSPTFGNIDMNEELSEPFYRTIAVVWSRVFSSVLWKILDTVQIDILAKIQQFNQKVGSELQKMGFPTNRIDQLKEQVEKSVKFKLTEMVLHLKPLVTAKQRDISRILSPHVQSRLVETYSAAASHTGKGCFQRMKQEMEIGVDSRKMYIFDDGSQKMMHELLNLKTELVNTVKAVCDMLLEEIQLSFEPLWEDPSQSMLRRDTLQQHMEEVCEEMKKIYRDASLQNTEEHAQSRKKPATTHHPPTPKRPQERKNVSEIVNMFISPVPEELTKMTKLEVVKVEKGSHMYPIKDVKQKPGLTSDSGIQYPSDVASSSGIDVTRIKMEVLSEFSQFLHHHNVEPPSHPAMLSTENSVNPSSMAGPSNVYDFGEASVTKNIQRDQTHKKINMGTNQRNIRIAPKNMPPELQLALENHMVRWSKQQTENSSIAVAAQEESGNSTRESSRAMVSLLKPKAGTSTAANEKQLAEISSSDSRQLIPGKRKTSCTIMVGTSSSGQAGTSLIQPKETTSKGTERNSCNIKGNLSSDLKRTAPSVSTGTTASGIKTPLSDKMETPLPITEDDDSLPEIFIAKRRKTTCREQNNPLHENVQENPTCTPGNSKISQKINIDTRVSTSSISPRPRLQSNSETKATAVSKTQTSKETGSQRSKLRIEHSDDSSSSSEMLQIIKQEPQEGDHFPHKQRSRHKQNPIFIDLTLSDDD
ncbi:hypothetical protein ACJMK2_010702 [Sinanodonta woodiana]|uniref:FHA domain-containing protein n=1 Tax=Sinanodonta woodiana TaxID=1069815 RepID=A0ABD3VG94_SINWO